MAVPMAPVIAIDAMGGDFAPVPEVAGAVEAVTVGGAHVVLLGDESRLREEQAVAIEFVARAAGPPVADGINQQSPKHGGDAEECGGVPSRLELLIFDAHLAFG